MARATSRAPTTPSAASPTGLICWCCSATSGTLDGHSLGGGVVLQFAYQYLRDRSTRAAFLRALRSVVDVRGQAVSSRDRLHLTQALPTMPIWGGRDPIVPASHARATARELPSSSRSSHAPGTCRTTPIRTASRSWSVLQRTEPRTYDPVRWRTLLAGGADEPLSGLRAV